MCKSKLISVSNVRSVILNESIQEFRDLVPVCKMHGCC